MAVITSTTRDERPDNVENTSKIQRKQSNTERSA